MTIQPLYASGLEGNQETPEPSWLLHLAKQANRTKHLATCFHVLAKGKVTGGKRARLLNDIGAAATNCLRYFQAAASLPGLFQPSASAGVPPPRFHDIIALLTMDHPHRSRLVSP